MGYDCALAVILGWFWGATTLLNIANLIPNRLTKKITQIQFANLVRDFKAIDEFLYLTSELRSSAAEIVHVKLIEIMYLFDHS